MRTSAPPMTPSSPPPRHGRRRRQPDREMRCAAHGTLRGGSAAEHGDRLVVQLDAYARSEVHEFVGGPLGATVTSRGHPHPVADVVAAERALDDLAAARLVRGRARRSPVARPPRRPRRRSRPQRPGSAGGRPRTFASPTNSADSDGGLLYRRSGSSTCTTRAVAHERHAVGECERLLALVRDEHDGHCPLARRMPHELVADRPRRTGSIEPTARRAGRSRARRERARERDPLLLAAGQLVWVAGFS